MESTLFKITQNFQLNFPIIAIEPFGNGHINDTYLVSTEGTDNPDYVLQRKNHLVFKDVPGMMENIIRITDHIREGISPDIPNYEFKVLRHIFTSDNNAYHKDEEGNYWTLCVAIKNCKSYEQITESRQAIMAGKAFGEFQRQVSDLTGKPLNITIPDFHNIEFRLANFEESLKVNHQNRKKEAKAEIDFVFSLEEEMKTLLNLEKQGVIPTRITHNDTKINNVLFDKEDNILCVIDLDTVMPGLFHYDFGDAIRTAANTASEDEKDLSKIKLNLSIFEAFSTGILEEVKDILTQKEIELLPHSAKFMTFIMGLRFLTDYLDGDVYYKTSHEEHNLQRAKAQFKLVAEVENNMEELKSIINSLIQ